MSKHSPSSNSQTISTTPARNPTGYADAAHGFKKTTAKNHKTTKKAPPRYASIVLFTNHQYENLLTTDPALLAIARLHNPDSVFFNFQQLIPSTDLEDLLVQKVGTVLSLQTRISNQQLLAKVLFKDPKHRQQAITGGVIIKGERIVALPHIAVDTNLVKVNIYQLPVCNLQDLTDELFHVLAQYGQIAQIRAYVSARHHIFKGEATALLDISLLGDRTPKFLRYIRLEKPFPARALIRTKDMPSFCGYCKTEGHCAFKCDILKEQRQKRQQPCDEKIKKNYVSLHSSTFILYLLFLLPYTMSSFIDSAVRILQQERIIQQMRPFFFKLILLYIDF